MPFTAESKYQFDFDADTAGNQGQPLLISDKGRFLWCEQPFSFRIGNGEIHAESKSGTIDTGAQGNTLREVYRHVSARYFPSAGKTPHEALFLQP